MKVTCSNHVSMSHLNWEFNSQHASQPNGREVFFYRIRLPFAQTQSHPPFHSWHNTRTAPYHDIPDSPVTLCRWNPFARRFGILGVIHAHSKRNRVVSKHGRLNTYRRAEENQESHRFLKDFFTSMIDLSWSWTLLSFATSFIISWVVFACLWYLVVLTHGDLSLQLPDDHVACVDNIQDFTSCFLFSLETQHTIG